MSEFQNEGDVRFEPTGSAPETAEGTTEDIDTECAKTRFAARLKSVNDHRVDTRDNPTPLTAVLRGMTGDLHEIGVHLTEAFRETVTAIPLTLENLEDYSPSIDLMIRVAKQAAQISQLEMRSARHEH